MKMVERIQDKFMASGTTVKSSQICQTKKLKMGLIEANRPTLMDASKLKEARQKEVRQPESAWTTKQPIRSPVYLDPKSQEPTMRQAVKVALKSMSGAQKRNLRNQTVDTKKAASVKPQSKNIHSNKVPDINCHIMVSELNQAITRIRKRNSRKANKEEAVRCQ